MSTIKKSDNIEVARVLYEDAAEKEPLIFNALQKECMKRQMPVTLSKRNVKSGGILGTWDNVIVIERKMFRKIYISTRTVGTYLYVSMIKNMPQSYSNEADIFCAETGEAHWCACMAVLKDTLDNLSLRKKSEDLG